MGDYLNKRDLEADSEDEEDEQDDDFTESEEEDETEGETHPDADVGLESLGLKEVDFDADGDEASGHVDRQLEEGELPLDSEDDEEDEEEAPPDDSDDVPEERVPVVRAPKREPQPYDVPTSGHFWLASVLLYFGDLVLKRGTIVDIPCFCNIVYCCRLARFS